MFPKPTASRFVLLYDGMQKQFLQPDSVSDDQHACQDLLNQSLRTAAQTNEVAQVTAQELRNQTGMYRRRHADEIDRHTEAFHPLNPTQIKSTESTGTRRKLLVTWNPVIT